MRSESEVLSHSERNSPAWQNVKAHIEKKIQLLRVKNDDTSKDLVKTSIVRGQILALKQLISTIEPKEL